VREASSEALCSVVPPRSARADVHDPEFRMMRRGLVMVVVAAAVMGQRGARNGKREGHDAHGCKQALSHATSLLRLHKLGRVVRSTAHTDTVVGDNSRGYRKIEQMSTSHLEQVKASM